MYLTTFYGRITELRDFFFFTSNTIQLQVSKFLMVLFCLALVGMLILWKKCVRIRFKYSKHNLLLH